MIKIENLVKTYKSKGKRKSTALKGISLTLPDTGMVFVIGKSGSGKSTLLNMIGGLDDITSGDIIVGNNKLSKFSLNDFANYRSTYVGFIFQDYHILNEFTVKENIELSADIRNVECDVKKCLEFVDLVGYEDRFPNELSGGQQQRVAIARALAKDSKVILADEPTGNLDAVTTKQILDLLKEMSKDRLVLIVSHNLDDAETYADRIISLDNGLVVNDVFRKEEYSNEYRIENNTLYLPHHRDLNEEQLKRMIDDKEKYEKIVQNDDGMIKTKDLNAMDKEVVLEKSSLSHEKFKKIFAMIFKRRTLNKVLTIFLASVIISLFYIFQSFNAFDENVQLVDYHKEEIKEDIVLKKNEYNNEEYSHISIVSIDENDISKIKELGYDGNVYKLYNDTISLGKHSTHAGYTLESLLSYSGGLYLSESYGTLNCTEEYLIKLYGIDGKLDIVGNMYDKEYGVTITDYIADALLVRLKKSSYEELIGLLNPSGNYYYSYINAVVKTNYKERYSSIFDEYNKLFDNDPTNDNIYDAIINNDQYYDFVLEVNKFLGISYNFSPNYEKLRCDSNLWNYSVLYYPTFSSPTKGETDSSFSIANSKAFDLTGNEACVSAELYNKLFNTNYTGDEDIEYEEIELSFTIKGKETFTKKFKVKKLFNANGTTLYTSKEGMADILEYKNIAYMVYLDGFEGIDNLSKHIDELGYEIISNDFTGVIYVERMISIFGKFLNIIALTLLLACVVYLMHYGYKSIINNYYEIGIISALGGNNKDIGKLFLLEILTVGIGILGISLIGMYIGSYLSNLVLLESFEIVFEVSFSNLDIVVFTWNFVIIDLVIAMIIVVISALFPMFYIRKVKPVNILKAKE